MSVGKSLKNCNKLISEWRLSVNKTKDSQNETADSGPPFFLTSGNRAGVIEGVTNLQETGRRGQGRGEPTDAVRKR
jgi:hypothetical protein